MSFHNEQIRDWAAAEVLSTGSRLAQRFSALQRLTGSQKDLPVLWQHSWDNPAIGHNWLTYDNVPASSRLPRNFTHVAMLTANRNMVDDIVKILDGQQAVAYLLGKNAVMVGTAPEGELFGIDDEDASRYIVGMRVGKGVLRALTGVQTPEMGFVPVIDPLSEGPVLPISEATGPVA